MKKKLISLAIIAAVILCMIPMSVPVVAKESLPGISQNTPIYTYTYKSSGRIYRYTNSSLTTKESGHWIDCATDLCRIIEIQNNAVKVIYPTSSGNKTGWFLRSEFCKGDLKADQAKYSFKATKNITTYRWKENNTKAGSIYNGDKVYVLRGDQNSNWLQVLYPVSGGYKMAWVRGSDLFPKASTTVTVTGIKLNKSSASVVVGSAITLSATVSPSNANNKSVIWSSSNTKIATVSGGKVKGVKAGTATITAKSNNGKTATCKITVTTNYYGSPQKGSYSGKQFLVFSQKDIRWANEPYKKGTINGVYQKTNVGKSACHLLSLVNATHWLSGEFVDPIWLARYAIKRGYRTNGNINMSGLYKDISSNYGTKYGIKYNGYKDGSKRFDELKKHLQKGEVAIGGGMGHVMAVVAYNKSSDKYLILDSYGTDSRGTKKRWYIWKSKSQMKGKFGFTYFYFLKKR